MSNQYGLPCHTAGITGFGDPTYRVMLVGLMPAENEIRLRKPMVGMTGKLLNAVLAGVGWHRDKTYVTNLYCHKTSRAECRDRLLEEISTLNPKLVITFGQDVWNALFSDIHPFSDARNGVWFIDNRYYLPTYLPTAVIRGQSYLMQDILKALWRIPDILAWPDDGSISNVNYSIISNPEHAQLILDILPRNAPVALDVETNKPIRDDLSFLDTTDVFVDDFLCLAISDGTNTYVFTPPALENLNWPLDVNWTFQNGFFDVNVLRRHFNIHLPIVEDTMLMSYSIDERQGHHGLKPLSRQWCAAGFYESPLHSFRKTSMGDVPKQVLYEYNARDAAYTARCAIQLRPKQEQDNVRSIYEEMLVRGANVFADTSFRGVKINTLQLHSLGREWAEKYEQQEIELHRAATECGWPNKILLTSPQQLSRLLFGHMGLPIIKRTPTGSPSTDKEVLESLSSQSPFVRKLIDLRKLGHILRHYVIGISNTVKKDGLLHFDVLPHGTVTGRLSYRNPPLQTIPKSTKVGSDLGRIRKIFVPRSDKYILLEADLKTAEVWIAYGESNDPQMLSDLSTGDFHLQASTSIYQKPSHLITEKERENSKYVTFGIMYGRGAKALSTHELQCTEKEAQIFMDRWHSRYPTYVEWCEKTMRTALRTGELVSVTGRKRRFGLINGSDAHEMLRQAINFPIQSAASDITLLAFYDLHESLRQYDSHVLFAVHDSLVFEINKDYLQEAATLIRKTMSKQWFSHYPPVPVDIKIGNDWFSMEKYVP